MSELILSEYLKTALEEIEKQSHQIDEWRDGSGAGLSVELSWIIKDIEKFEKWKKEARNGRANK